MPVTQYIERSGGGSKAANARYRDRQKIKLKIWIERKRCSKCKRVRLRKFFYSRKVMNNGLASECKSCGIEADRNYRKNNSEKYRLAVRRMELRKRYGITLEQFEAILLSQGGGCAICGRSDRLCVDHDHVTGVIRGILCKPCNLAIGNLYDNPALALNLAKYLSDYVGGVKSRDMLQ